LKKAQKFVESTKAQKLKIKKNSKIILNNKKYQNEALNPKCQPNIEAKEINF